MRYCSDQSDGGIDRLSQGGYMGNVEQVVAWIGAVTGLASAVKAWREALASGAPPAEAKKAAEAVEAPTEAEAEATAEEVPQLQAIDASILQALLDDIKSAQRRFVEALRDPQYTPAQIDQEEAIARASVCRHLLRIKEFNGGSLGSKAFERMWLSNRCSQNAFYEPADVKPQ
jgi:hypothetical protein